MVGYEMRGDNRGAPLLFCSLHRTISTRFHVPLLLPAPASPPRQGHTCTCVACFPAKRHKRGCWGALDGVEAMSLRALPMQSGAQLQEFCSLVAHCCRHLRASPLPLFVATPQTRGRGDLCVPRGLFPRWLVLAASPPGALPSSLQPLAGTHCSSLTFLL